MSLSQYVHNISKRVMDEAFEELRSFNPYRIDDLSIIVPIQSGWGYSHESQLAEMEEVSGIDSELWTMDQGYFRLEHPPFDWGYFRLEHPRD